MAGPRERLFYDPTTVFEEAFAPDPSTTSATDITAADMEIYGSHVIFERLDAAGWIKKHRLPRLGALHVDATAAALGLRLADTFDGGDAGEPLVNDETEAQPPGVLMRRWEDEPARRFAFGHGVGHYFLERTLGMDAAHKSSRLVERFCHQFGREMVVPRDQLPWRSGVNEEKVLEIMTRFEADLKTVLLQLMHLGELDRKVFVYNSDTQLGVEGMEARIGQVVCFHCAAVQWGLCDSRPVDTFTRLDFSNHHLGPISQVGCMKVGEGYEGTAWEDDL